MTTQTAITWPERFLPGTVDGFASNETIAKGVTAIQVWRYLIDTSLWKITTDGITNITFPSGGGPVLSAGLPFAFSALGVESIPLIVTEFVEPADGVPGRLTWQAKITGTPEEYFEAVHGWIVEDLPGGRVRVLTQETQIGELGKKIAAQHPNPMLVGHQSWIEGLVAAARR